MERRLAAVLVADAPGFNRLAGADEEATLVSSNGLRAAVVDPAIVRHGGRVFKTTWAGLLAALPSAVEPIRCAAGIRHEVAETGPSFLDDGVNIAARAALAP